MARKIKRRAGKAKVVFLNPTPKRRKRRSSRRRAVKANPAPARKHYRRRRRHAVLSNPSRRRRHSRRHNPAPGSLTVGRSLTDGVVSVVEGGVGFFGGMFANKLFPASMLRYRGGILAILALVGMWKIPNKHARMALMGLAIQGAVDGLRQNVSIFSQMAGDDASETIMGISTQRGNPALGYSATDALNGADDGFDGDEPDGDEMMGAYGSGLSGENW